MKRKIKLYSTNKDLYPDRFVWAEVRDKVDIDEMADSCDISATKKTIVQARSATLGETIYTIPKVVYEGKEYIINETSRVVTEKEIQDGAIVVINPIGEEYLISSREKFEQQYKAVDGGYASLDGVNKFRKSLGNYVFIAPWGKEQVVLKGSYFCITNPQKIYSITNVAFDNDYSIN